MAQHNDHIDYVEFKTKDLNATKVFYNKAFGWTFTDYGDTYIAFEGAGLQGGFELTQDPIVNGALIVLYHDDLKLAKQNVIDAGGTISIDIFSFPGGSRFHFLDPSGNDLAVWRQD